MLTLDRDRGCDFSLRSNSEQGIVSANPPAKFPAKTNLLERHDEENCIGFGRPCFVLLGMGWTQILDGRRADGHAAQPKRTHNYRRRIDEL
jgi:hypothetical protein